MNVQYCYVPHYLVCSDVPLCMAVSWNSRDRSVDERQHRSLAINRSGDVIVCAVVSSRLVSMSLVYHPQHLHLSVIHAFLLRHSPAVTVKADCRLRSMREATWDSVGQFSATGVIRSTTLCQKVRSPRSPGFTELRRKVMNWRPRRN